MNKSVDERLLPAGEYVDAQNVRVGSTEDSEIGSLENSKGNTKLTDISYSGQPLSSEALCIGVYEDGANETIYWFVNDPSFGPTSPTNKLDLIVSFDTKTSTVTYHVISIDDGSATSSTTLNFNRNYLITGVELVDDLLFFTDNYNPPRFINVDRTYAAPGTTDYANDPATLAKALQVIKQPPVEAPSIALSTNGDDDTLIEEEFFCFAYRYKYADNEYSATSPFTVPAFVSKNFEFNISTYLNEGMTNFYNSVEITYNTGDSLVKEIQLLYKKIDDSTIRVIETLDKEDLPGDNVDATYTFGVSKIFTVLPQAEILRLYDNVPRLAQAETIMGNRLMYGNYTEGYNLLSAGASAGRDKVKFDFTTELVSTALEESTLTSSILSNSYLNPIPPAADVTANSRVSVDLSDIIAEYGSLKKNDRISVRINVSHSTWVVPGGVTDPTDTPSFTFLFTYTLQQDFANAYDLTLDDGFREALGLAQSSASVPSAIYDWNTTTNMAKVYNTTTTAWESCDGTTISDNFLCSDNIPNITYDDSVTPATAYYKFNSYNDAPWSFGGSPVTPRGISAYGDSSGDTIEFELPYVEFVDSTTSPSNKLYEFFEITNVVATYTVDSDFKSLHSNRSYEVGMVYMDEFNRSTTVQVSNNNTVHVPCSASDKRNKIKVNIPTTQKAPPWAKRYKFFIKADKENYETIYSDYYVFDAIEGVTYFLLQGEQAAKVTDGDRYFVKADVTGPLDQCVTATVLEKKAQPADFLDPLPEGVTSIPAGTYMKMRASGFSALTSSEKNFVVEDTESAAAGSGLAYPQFKCGVDGGFRDGSDIPYTIPQGSRVSVRLTSSGVNSLFEGKEFEFDRFFFSTADYADIIAWWNGDNIAPLIESVVVDAGYSFDYISTVGTSIADLSPAVDTFRLQWVRDAASSPVDNIVLKGVFLPGTISVVGVISATFNVTRSNQLIVFETQPSDAQPDVFYESADTFDIYGTGLHRGNDQDQTATDPAIITTDFFNCFAFGNGVESYKVRDSIIGAALQLGNRVSTTSAQDYREIRRFADIAYSGVYNDETNTNKLNEFNLGLANFKPLEDVYGEIQRMDGRETDVLVLQEDKISYVLAGKNLLSDAAAGGTITSVPEVLGTQIARLEEHGISFNPESYAKYGADKFFTDQKRGAVIQLRGSSYSNEQLTLISERGMRSFFRDLFLDAPNTQKLGGYDPYMNEYVLSSIDRPLPVPAQCLECGFTQQYTITDSTLDLCVEFKKAIGEITVSGDVLSISGGGQVTFSYAYPPGSPVTVVTPITTTGSYTFNIDRNDPSENTVDISIAVTGTATLSINVPCNTASNTIEVVQVCFSDDADAGKFIHNEYRWRYYSTELASSTNTLVTANMLVDSAATFVTDGVAASDVVVNTDTGRVASVVTVDSETQLTLDQSIFPSSSANYKVFDRDSEVVEALQSNEVPLLSGTGAPNVSQYSVVSGAQGTAAIPPNGAIVEIISNKITPGDNFQFDPTTIPWASTETYNKFRYLRTATEYPNTESDMINLISASSLLEADTVTPLLDTYSNSFYAGTTGDYLYMVYDYRTANQLSLRTGSTDDDACCGSTSANYVINAPTLAKATSVFVDADPDMVSKAANQFYSSGSTSRQQASGVLEQADVCRVCDTSCPGSISNARGTYGSYNYTFSTGNTHSDVGAIIVYIESISTTVSPQAQPILGFGATFDGSYYNEVVSSSVGTLGTYPTGVPTYFGTTSVALCSGIPTPPALSIPVYAASSTDTTFVNQGYNDDVDIVAAQNLRTGTPPDSCMVVIPKPALATGTTTGTTTDKLVDSGADFSSVTIGDIVRNTTGSTTAFVTAVDTQTQLSLSSDIFTSGEDYIITSASATEVSIEVISPCPDTGSFSARWRLDINCPAPLTLRRGAPTTGAGVCNTLTSNNYYHAPQATSTAGTLAVNDMLFSDADGVTLLPTDQYSIEDDGSTGTHTVVDVTNGVITALGSQC